MKIAIIQNVPLNDHRMIHTDGIATELTKRGNDVNVIIQESANSHLIKDRTYNFHFLPGNTYSIMGQINFMYNLFKYFKKETYDIVHAKNPFSSILPVLLYKNKFKIIYDERGLWIDFGIYAGYIPKWISPFLNMIEIFCLKKSDSVITISEELKNILIDKGVDKKNINVIVGDGVDFNKISQISEKDVRDYLKIKGKIIGYVGSIERSRFSERIIEAFKYVHNEIDSVKLVMIGPCKEELFFKKLIKGLELENEVFLTGYLPHHEVLGFMKSFDVAVSYHEGDLPIFNVAVPTKILEYLASGCNIVTPDQIMYKNILTHKIDGFLTGQNPKLFAQGILTVLENIELSSRLSKNAVKTVKKYTFTRIADQVETIYRGILGE